MSIAELLALCALGLIAWYWFDSLKAREACIAAARAACEREGVQLLDETVVGRSMRFGRNDNGHLAIRRTYDFEYSDSGFDRFGGSVVLLGRDVEMLDVSAHRSTVILQMFH